MQHKVNNYLIDYISFTTKYRSILQIMELLGLDHITWEDTKGAQGYKSRCYFSFISIHYDGNNDTIWCELTGQGCRAFEEYGTGDYDSLFKELITDDVYNITRLDIAYDDHEGILDINKIFVDVVNKLFICKCDEHMYTGGTRGISIQHGRKISKTLIRIYDKAAEQKKSDVHWIRVELQLRKENAQSFLKQLVRNEYTIGQMYSGVVNNYLRYVNPGTDTNRWRWNMKPYWKKFINSAEKIKIYEKPGIEYQLVHLEKFVIKQAGNAIKTYMEIQGMDNFFNYINDKEPEKIPKYNRLLENERMMNERMIKGTYEPKTAEESKRIVNDYKINKEEEKYTKLEREAIQNEEQSEMR
ncbi:MAG: replication initiation factor domain-containing protein [Oscillospiraceae bacterium]|jgi:phage replication initiation protein|nr:replication initiation factor domain-containing protein [Oscillospiraceae bacterium]